MKFNCGPTPKERAAARAERLDNWHPFFCLLPRRLGTNDCRWLETIERRRTGYAGGAHYHFEWWEYRAK